MKLVVAFGKVAVLAIWAWGVLSFLTPSMVPAPNIGRMALFGLLAVHVAEVFVFAKNLAAESGGSVGSHSSRLLIFGYLHVMGVRYGG